MLGSVEVRNPRELVGSYVYAHFLQLGYDTSQKIYLNARLDSKCGDSSQSLQGDSKSRAAADDCNGENWDATKRISTTMYGTSDLERNLRVNSFAKIEKLRGFQNGIGSRRVWDAMTEPTFRLLEQNGTAAICRLNRAPLQFLNGYTSTTCLFIMKYL